MVNFSDLQIKIDDLSSGEVLALLEEHLKDMYATSPAESVHALDVDALKRCLTWACTSSFNTRPLGPVPVIPANDTPSSRANLRTAGPA